MQIRKEVVVLVSFYLLFYKPLFIILYFDYFEDSKTVGIAVGVIAGVAVLGV